MSDAFAIDIKHLKFRWHPTQPNIIDIPNLQVRRGERVFIQGSSGSGKSTLLNLVAGVLTGDDGEIELLGRPLSALSQSERDAFRGDHIGFIFQQFNLLPFLNVFENIVLAGKFSKVRAKKVRNPRAEVMRLLEELEMDPSTYLDRKTNELSVGQQQRIAVARALYGSPEIIIADEPTSALDHDTRNRFLELLLKESSRSKTTVLFVSHDSTIQHHFDRTETLRGTLC